jgi:hypothetical protein
LPLDLYVQGFRTVAVHAEQQFEVVTGQVFLSQLVIKILPSLP